MKAILIPLDERPCNYDYPRFVSESSNIELFIPPIEMLGKKKQRANREALWNYLFEKAKDCDYAILSLDMLLYGGLLPSRIHHDKKEELKFYLNQLERLKSECPQLTIYAFSCIMRSPQYNSSEEEPDYYENFGYALFKRAYLMDKKQRVGLSHDEEVELEAIEIDVEIIEDYEQRRNLNLDLNIESLRLVKNGVIEHLVIPQDDSCVFGYTAIAQKRVVTQIETMDLELSTQIYPGADEVGCSLLIRAYNHAMQRQVKIYPMFASTLGSSLIPLYEDRPILESLKAHVRVCGAKLVDVMSEADLILAYNCPGLTMQESFDQNERELTYTSYRCLYDFVLTMSELIMQGKKVIVCDSAYANGGDLQLLAYMDKLNLLDKIYGYAGWNTNCNSLGSVLAHGMFALDNKIEKQFHHLFIRYIEDGIYQPLVRKKINDELLPLWQLSYYDFKDRQSEVEEQIKDMLQKEFDQWNVSKNHPYKIHHLTLPWNRMFEISLDIHSSIL